MTVKIPRALSVGEETMALHLKDAKIPFEREFYFCSGRKWRSDFRLTNTNILIEIDGGGEKGRHQRHYGFMNDLLKLNRACILGYRVLRYTFGMVKNGIAIADIQEILQRRPV